MFMSDCRKALYFRCSNMGMAKTDTGGSDHVGIVHHIDHKVEVNLGFDTLYSIKTLRNFSLQGTHTYAKKIYHVWEVTCDGLGSPPCYAWCYDRNDDYQSSMSENCKIEKDTIYYLDMSRNIVFYKHEEENLVFATTSSEISMVRTKFSTDPYYKLKIRGAKIKGKEQHILVFNGVKSIMNEVDYEREPAWSGMEAVGLPNSQGGTTYATTGECAGYDRTIQQIILWPNPPSKASPMDMEVRCLGFYDYGSSDPGSESELNILDGGNKDYFYPSWDRGMLEDTMWGDVRTRRYDMTWNHSAARGASDYKGETILNDPVPHGNAFFHEKLGGMYGFVFRNRDGKAFSVSAINGATVSQHIIDLGVKGYGSDWAYHPISVI